MIHNSVEVKEPAPAAALVWTDQRRKQVPNQDYPVVEI